ncbi:MAG: hypothetical protein DCC58_14620 [Chloroflexi bacterium]|nr:MAG: hypothetical protein DCC58_14620 [Chloroflexota bacterium]
MSRRAQRQGAASSHGNEPRSQQVQAPATGGKAARQMRAGAMRPPTGPASHAQAAGAADPAPTPSRAAESAATAQAGEDTRRRGWFWHWNNVITQYAPLLGLKGVGLLNSYTVWTDRREESPHRGYAFPSQQAEAAFYGEERSELITINKILVALDLIEIRKEMLQRTDAQGRRWKVPHNLYRVKDRPDGMALRVDDVLRVVELAERDDDVYRYIRRVFSSKFAPIDRDNVWHTILAELEGDPRWEALRARTAQREAKASARTRAGHETRAGRPVQDQARAVMTTGQIEGEKVAAAEQTVSRGNGPATSVAEANTGSRTEQSVVPPSNNGSGSAVGQSNEGMEEDALGTVATSNPAAQSAVGQSNTTYDQYGSTTTTTTIPRSAGTRQRLAADSTAEQPVRRNVPGPGSSNGLHPSSAFPLAVGTDRLAGTLDSATQPSASPAPEQPAATPLEVAPMAHAEQAGQRPDAASGSALGGPPRSAGGHAAFRGLDQPHGNGPVGDPSPLVVSLFEAANDRRASPLERVLLAELERAADPAARRTGSCGSELVAAAIREAVSSGSAFVAPKRLQEIVNRWLSASDGATSATVSRGPVAGASAGSAQPLQPAEPAGLTTAQPVAEAPVAAATVRLPGGRSGIRVWQDVLADLAGVLDAEAFDRLLAGSAPLRYRAGCVDVQVASDAAAEKLATEYYALVARRLNERLPRPVDLRFVAPPAPPQQHDIPAGAALPDPALAEPGSAVICISRADADAGRQLWRSLLLELGATLAPDDRARLSDVVPLGQDRAGRLLLGAPTRHVARLLDTRYRGDIERACARILGRPCVIHPQDPSAWMVLPT